ncbi:MAG: hypothetical protein JWO19_2142 [Bryobacterales bacterium]|nr:hypothetical protein [Bryobacterales bacterium]
MMRALALAIAIGLLASGPASGQTAAKGQTSSKSWALPRTADGQPDLQGVWTNATITPLERPAELAGKQFFLNDQEAQDFEKRAFAQINSERRDGGPEVDVGRSYNEFWRDRGTKVVANRRTSLITDPPDGKVPELTADAQKKQSDARAYQRLHPSDGPEDRNLWERCLTRGVPMIPGPYNNDFQIIQAPGYVVIFNEMIHEARVVPLDSRAHVEQNVRQWLGDPRGHWEGDTLVVDSTNFSEKSSFRGSSTGLHLVERFTRTGPDTINYQFRVDDPATFSKPWSVEMPMTRMDSPIFEYACNEGNYAMLGLLGGARADEKNAEKKAADAAAKKGAK